MNNGFIKTTRKGFTLIELIIVITIILFLVKTFMPNIQHYFSKARQAEVALTLSAIYAAQQEYHLLHGTFTSNIAETGWKPKQQPEKKGSVLLYTYGCYDGNAQEGIHLFTGTSKTPASFLQGSYANEQSFLIKAALLEGTTIDIWSINEEGTLTHEKSEKLKP